MNIGIFDSGIGGMTLLHQAMIMLPQENFIFYADIDHVPYGTKTKEQVISYVDEVMQFINANRVIRGDEVIEREQSGVVPTVKELIDKLLIKLDTAIAGESDPSSLSRTLQNLYSYDVSIKAANQDQAKKSSCSTVAEAVEKKFKKI